MSTPTVPAAGVPEVKREQGCMRLGKYVKRMSSVFKRHRSSKQPSAASQPATHHPAPPKHHPLPVEQGVKEQATASALALPSPIVAIPSVVTPAATATATVTATATTPLPRHAMQQERARALFAKYGLTLEPHEWTRPSAPMPAVQRIERAVRVRVHRSCHRCGTLYGADKTCQQCDHKRCKKCPRYPLKKKTASTDKLQDPDAVDHVTKKQILTLTTTFDTELAHQRPKQRIRRTCHKCETLFSPPTATVCDGCQHVQCTDCPREPAKLSKWATDSPGNGEANSNTNRAEQLDTLRRTWRKPRLRVRWQCDKCFSMYPNYSHSCPGCGHERCDQCTRSPAKKSNKGEEFDPHLVAVVEAKLRALAVMDDLLSPGAGAT